MPKTKTKPAVKPEKKKRERYVYPTDNIPHLWAHQTQSDARNPGGNLFFQGTTIYSYGRHFPVARIVQHRTREGVKSCVFFTSRHYSVTTAKHTSYIRRSLHGELGPVFSMYDPAAPPAAALMRYREDLYRLAQELKAAKSYLQRAKLYQVLQDKLGKVIEFAEFFGLKMSGKPNIDKMFSAEEVAALEADVEKADEAERQKERKARESSDRRREDRQQQHQHTHERYVVLKAEQAERYKVQEAERQRVRAEREAELLQRREEYTATWRAGGHVPHDFLYAESMPTMLRIRGDQVESSHGVQFPLDHGMRVMRLIRRIIERGQEWHTNGQVIRLGHYRLDSIDAEGTVHAGCHAVPRDEVLRIIEQAEAMPTAANYPEADACESELNAAGVGAEDSSDAGTTSD